MGQFEQRFPSIESYWRAVILFGQNAASYKFALAKSLLELASAEKTFITLEELALPFAMHVVEHIKVVDKQGQRPTGPFLQGCRSFVTGEIDVEKLRAISARYGFINVIDAFHVVNRAPIPISFFEDAREKRGGIVVTDQLLALKSRIQFENLPIEVEARWNLVQTAWDLGISRSVLAIHADERGHLFVINRDKRRKSVTSSRDALNGYQKGKCFYCFRDISIVPSSDAMADVDHFFARTLSRDEALTANLDGVWNLVLACRSCNRGSQGKSTRVPAVHYLDRLHTRNEFLIASHHPLRETLMLQMGQNETGRSAFLRQRYAEAAERLVHEWRAPSEEAPAF
jgi:5-methylcytosine-specific restriction endonuclease McrA